MKAPTTKWGQFALMFVSQMISFFVIVSNTRAYTHGSYTWTAVTDTMICGQNFIMGKLMMDDPNGRTWWAGAGMTIGGTIGSLLAIFTSSHLGF